MSWFTNYLITSAIVNHAFIQPLLIYIVEDDKDDQYLLRIALEKYSPSSRLRFFANGAELIVWLTHQLDGRLPDLIMLDLDMPVMNGLDTLQVLKQAQEYKQIPVFVRSGQEEPSTINRCYELGCEGYLIKTHEQHQLARAISELKPGGSVSLPAIPKRHDALESGNPID